MACVWGRDYLFAGLKTVIIVRILFSDASCAETAYFGGQKVKITYDYINKTKTLAFENGYCEIITVNENK